MLTSIALAMGLLSGAALGQAPVQQVSVNTNVSHSAGCSNCSTCQDCGGLQGCDDSHCRRKLNGGGNFCKCNKHREAEWVGPLPYGYGDPLCARPNTYFFDQHGSWRNSGDMVQHLPYYPCAHGYYYFKAYHWTRLRYHTKVVTHWGGDPRHPYANAVFKRVYDEMEAEGQLEPEKDLREAAGGTPGVDFVPKDPLPPAPMPEDEETDEDLDTDPLGSATPRTLPNFVQVRFLTP